MQQALTVQNHTQAAYLCDIISTTNEKELLLDGRTVQRIS